MASRHAELSERGYVTMPGFLDSGTVAAIDAALDPFAAIDRAPHLAEVPEIAAVIFSDRMLELAAELLGGDPITFPDHSCRLRGGSFGYHKDNVDRLDPTGPDWEPADYPMLRFGVYLEDFTGRSGALAIQPGSHRGVEYARPAVNLITRPGDVAAWYFTITHAAASPSLRSRPKVGPRVPVNHQRVVRGVSAATRAVSRWPIMAPWADRRRVLFFPYMVRSPLVARYISLLLHRDYYQAGLRADPAQGAAPAAAVGKVPWFNPSPYLDRADPALIADGFYQDRARAGANLLADDIWAELQTCR